MTIFIFLSEEKKGIDQEIRRFISLDEVRIVWKRLGRERERERKIEIDKERERERERK